MPGHNLKVEAIYDRERAEQHIWEAARTAGMSRCRFLQLMISTGAGLTAMSVLPAGLRIARADHVQVVKPTPPELFKYNLQARATDRAGNSQPESVPFNEQGYLYTAVVRHPITVA